MSGNHHIDPKELRAGLNFPVIDSDGHWIEYGPVLVDYLKKVGGNAAADGFLSRERNVASTILMSPEQRREERRAQQAWWALPTKNTRDRATALMPKLLYERMEEFGFDFTVLYPTTGLGVPFIGNDEMRQATCRALNTYMADAFREFHDRMTPAAVIPMNTPDEAIAELEHAVTTLGLKVVVMASLVRRPIRAAGGSERRSHSAWYDVLALDSEYDYDPVWAKCVELKIAPTFHSASRGLGFRQSTSNFTYNHIGHFAAAGEAVCKAIFMGGVTRRFPTLKFAFLEGGVGWACQLYADLIGHWKKRNAAALAEVDPANLDRKQLGELLEEFAGREWADRLGDYKLVPEGEAAAAAWAARGPAVIDDYAACGIKEARDIRDLFARNFYFGCEADDPMNAWGFNPHVNPYGAKLKMLFGSDIGHFDVPDMREVLGEAHELVDEGVITKNDFRDFVFTWPVEFWGGMNPDFFKGTTVEGAARRLLKRVEDGEVHAEARAQSPHRPGQR
jgi:predicted TIM-barrel fold metal-dependent hydrolase